MLYSEIYRLIVVWIQLVLLLWIMLLVLNRMVFEEIRMNIVLIVRCSVGSCRNRLVIILIRMIIMLVISILLRNDMFLCVVSIQVEQQKKISVVLFSVRLIKLFMLVERYVFSIGLRIQLRNLVKVKVEIILVGLFVVLQVRNIRLYIFMRVKMRFGEGSISIVLVVVVIVENVSVRLSRKQVLCRILCVLSSEEWLCDDVIM